MSTFSPPSVCPFGRPFSPSPRQLPPSTGSSPRSTRHAGDRPAAWIDDAFDASCHAWAAARRAPTLLVATDPAIGMTDAHVARLERFAAGLPDR